MLLTALTAAEGCFQYATTALTPSTCYMYTMHKLEPEPEDKLEPKGELELQLVQQVNTVPVSTWISSSAAKRLVVCT